MKIGYFDKPYARCHGVLDIVHGVLDIVHGVLDIVHGVLDIFCLKYRYLEIWYIFWYLKKNIQKIFIFSLQLLG